MSCELQLFLSAVGWRPMNVSSISISERFCELATVDRFRYHGFEDAMAALACLHGFLVDADSNGGW